MKKSSEVLLVAVALLLSFVIPSLKAGSDTPEQKTTLHELHQQTRAAGQVFKADSSLNRDAKLAKLRELKPGCRDQAKSITAPVLSAQPQTHRI